MAAEDFMNIGTMVSLAEVVDVSILQEIQDRFSLATGMGAVIVDLNGVPITKYSMFSPFCYVIRNHPEGLARCRMSDAFLGERASRLGTIQMHYCHAGLIDMAAPIVVNDQHVGTILCGQMLGDSLDLTGGEANFESCLQTLGLDREKMAELRRDIPVLPSDKVHAAAGLLQIIANFIVGMGINSLNEAIINNIKMCVMEEQRVRLELERSLRISELKSLQSTVNPHFLFNALNTIARLAMLENAPQTEEITFALADLLRHSLRKVGKLVPLREEVDHILKYLQIQGVRFADRIHPLIDIPEEVMNFRLPVMTLQPLVENAIEHGLSEIPEGGQIRVSARMEQGALVLTVADSGAGISPERLAELRQSLHVSGDTDHMTGIGLSNVYKQLSFYFGAGCSLEIDSEPGKGTCVTLRAEDGSAEH